jgi:hypothetical protein
LIAKTKSYPSNLARVSNAAKKKAPFSIEDLGTFCTVATINDGASKLKIGTREGLQLPNLVHQNELGDSID